MSDGCREGAGYCPQLSQTGEKEWQERGGGYAGYASNRRMQMEEYGHLLLPNLKKLGWGWGGGVSGNRKDFMDPRKTGYQHANVTSKRKGSHFQLRINLT